jgi:hypothetical protein
MPCTAVSPVAVALSLFLQFGALGESGGVAMSLAKSGAVGAWFGSGRYASRRLEAYAASARLKASRYLTTGESL